MATLKARLDALDERRRTKTIYQLTDDELLDAAGLPSDATTAQIVELIKKRRKERSRGSEPSSSYR